MTGIQLHSSAFRDHDDIPAQYSRQGGNISPPLEWSGVPEQARELVLVCADPDAPGGTFLHWLVSGIDPHSNGLEPGRPPAGGHEYPNSFGQRGWDGPQPPIGDRAHRYMFELFALPEPFGESQASTTVEELLRNLQQRSLASGELVGTFQR